MVEIADSLRSLFSASIEEQDETYQIEVPASEVTHNAISAEKTYRVAILEFPSPTGSSTQERSQRTSSHGTEGRPTAESPVDEGEVRDVTIESVGDQGDGIAKVERGYVVIVSSAQPGDEPTVEIEQVNQNVAFASIVDSDPRAL